MRSEREPDRYEPLNETHRRVAEEEEKRRLAEQEQARSAQAQPEPHRPGPDPRPQRPEAEPDYSPDAIEARLKAEQERLEKLFEEGRITESDKNYRFSHFDQNLRIEIEQADKRPPGRSGNRGDEMAAEPEHGEPQFQQRPEDTRDQPSDQGRDDPSQRAPETRIEREAQTAEYEITGRAEMSDARAARLALLRSIDRDIERENRENEGKGPDLGHDSGDRSR